MSRTADIIGYKSSRLRPQERHHISAQGGDSPNALKRGNKVDPYQTSGAMHSRCPHLLQSVVLCARDEGTLVTLDAQRSSWEIGLVPLNPWDSLSSYFGRNMSAFSAEHCGEPSLISSADICVGPNDRPRNIPNGGASCSSRRSC